MTLLLKAHLSARRATLASSYYSYVLSMKEWGPPRTRKTKVLERGWAWSVYLERWRGMEWACTGQRMACHGM